MKPAKQILPIFAAFSYFAMVLEQNEKPDKELMKLYRQLTRLCKCNDKEMNRRVATINGVVKKYPQGREIEYILVSVCIISAYYEATSRYRTYYHPMEWDTIHELIDECCDNLDNKTIERESMDLADYIVKELLCEKKI